MLTDTDLHNEVEDEILQLNFDETHKLRTILNKIRKADYKGEIGLINRTFYSSLRNSIKNSLNIKEENLKSLDKANIYTWIAYTLYDDVLDEKEIDLMSPANILLRLSYQEYIKAGLDIGFLNKYFLAVDSANAKELSLRKDRTLNIQPYKLLLSNKSIAHCIGQLWMIEKAKPQVLDFATRGCHAYCAARQLSDDIYDWRDDLVKGDFTFAVVSLLNSAGIKPEKVMTQDEIKILNVTFWQTQLEYLCREVINFIDINLDSFKNILKKESEYTSRFILPIKKSAEQAIYDHGLKKKEFEKNVS